ncbi:hypothetical protein COOONC_20523 [Cooperia oncophora]
MSKVTPAELECVSSATGSRVGFLVTMAARVFGIMSRRFERRISDPASVQAMENGIGSALGTPTLPPVYQQSSTRRLAFGSTPYDTSHPQKDFYNNSTLVNLSKLFCVAVLLTAFVLVMTHGFSYFSPDETNSNSTSTATFFL